MKVILSAKQVGNVAYWTKTATDLYSILETGQIYYGKNSEYNEKSSKSEKSISFTRDFMHPHFRNPNRWKFAVILDGSKLSERYHIEPYSYSGQELPKNGRRFKIKTLTSYKNNTATISLVGFRTVSISLNLFNVLKNEIDNLDDEIKTTKKLGHQTEGKRKTHGTFISEKYTFNSPVGDGGYILENTSQNVRIALSKELQSEDLFDETEERIWNRYNEVNISSSVIGLILPEDSRDEFENEQINACIDLLKSKYHSSNVQYY